MGCNVLLSRNDTAPEKILELLNNSKAQDHEAVLVLSPGPSAPQDANNLIPIIKAALGKFPMLGICLGHQALGLVLGGEVTRAGTIVHGKSSDITHDGQGAFKDLPNPLKVARYHSLIVKDLPKNVEISASFDGMCMALRERKLKICGFQFHPESIMTTFGRKLLQQALDEICS